MNNILFVTIIITLFIGTMFFLAYMNNKRDRSERDRLREVVKAIKSKDVKEYDLVLPPDEEAVLEEGKESEFIPLEEVDPTVLLKSQKK